MKYPVPDYLLKRAVRTLRLLKEQGEFDRANTKVANALRTVGKDCDRLERIINSHNPDE